MHFETLQLDFSRSNGRLSPAWIADTQRRLAERRETRAIVIRGTTDVFCEGLDLTGILDEPAGGDGGVGDFARLLDALAVDERPVIAVVEAPVKGGGMGLTAVADYVIATDAATFALPEVVIGLMPSVVFPYVARRIGVSRARTMAIFGEPIDAAYATVWGLVDELTIDVEKALSRRLARLSRIDPNAIAAIKRIVGTHFTGPVDYRSDAVEAFTKLLASPATRARVRRLNDGLAPWDDSDDA